MTLPTDPRFYQDTRALNTYHSMDAETLGII